MNYFSQALVLVASDLRENANFLREKRKIAGDLCSADGLESTLIWTPTGTPLPEMYRRPNSRLVILAHGSSRDTDAVYTAHKFPFEMWSAQLLARRVSVWLAGSKVQRISLHVCHAARSISIPEKEKDKWVLKPDPYSSPESPRQPQEVSAHEYPNEGEMPW